MNKEEIIIGFENQNGFRVAPDSDITTGKIIVNDIEITSIEDWEKVTNSLIELQKENEKLKEELLKLEDKYIHNVPCCNGEDCEFYKKYTETSYLKGYEDGIEKYNHYKLLYQKVKERNDKAIEYANKKENMKLFTGAFSYGEFIGTLEDILKGNNEVSNEDNR